MQHLVCVHERTVKETALCGRNDIKEPERTSALIGNICLSRTVIAAGHFFFPDFLFPSCIKTQQQGQCEAAWVGWTRWAIRRGTGGWLRLCVLSSCPLYTDFASALKGTVVFAGQPKQGWMLNRLSLAA